MREKSPELHQETPKYIKNITKIAKTKGWEIIILPQKSEDKLTIKCNNGHVLVFCGYGLSANSKCKYCSKLIIAKRKASLINHEIIDTLEFKTDDDEVLLKCEFSHIFKRVLKKIINTNAHCPECKEQKKFDDNFKLYSEFAIKQDGTLLTKEIENSLQKCSWKCDKGHNFQLTPRAVKDGLWCQECKKIETFKKNRVLFENIISKKDAGFVWESNEIKCEKVTIICKNSHSWQTNIKNIIRGRWCPTCFSLSIMSPLSDYQKIALKKGGKCLSTTTTAALKHLQFECAKGHQWAATGNSIKRGSWCRLCQQE